MLWGRNVSKCYDVKLIQYEADKRLLDDAIAEYTAITEQLGYENNEAVRKRLTRQQEQYRQRMDQLAQKCDRVWQRFMRFSIMRGTKAMLAAGFRHQNLVL
jgi:hypothetical protein